MSETRKRYSSAFKFQLALEAAKEGKTINQIAGEHGVHPNQVSQWKRQLVDEGPKLFRGGNGRQERELVSQQTELFEQIGRLKMELTFRLLLTNIFLFRAPSCQLPSAASSAMGLSAAVH
ncbi:MAG: hypothetical protein AUK55_07645 [Syntrophobacteraceae bacterium CG2_30_61_12]|nr:MAG: hypothetical protein AUK55_07645 [Syntrophobacteraceae bacterium CG2_30_61_12]